MQKKGQGISVNVIVIAAIALLVLVILAVLILRAGGGLNEGTGCESVSGQCRSPTIGCVDGSEIQHLAMSGTRGGCEQNELCCIPI